MLVDVHTHCIQPEHVGEASKLAMERAGYPPMKPLSFEEFSREMEVVGPGDSVWGSSHRIRQS